MREGCRLVRQSPGKITLSIPALRRHRLWAHRLKRQLSTVDGVAYVRVLPSCGRLAIEFDPIRNSGFSLAAYVESLSPSEMRAARVPVYDEPRPIDHRVDKRGSVKARRLIEVARPPATQPVIELSATVASLPRRILSGLLHFDEHPGVNLVISLFTLSMALSGVLSPIPMNILLVLTSLPVYRRAAETIWKEHKLSVDFLDALAHITAQLQEQYSTVAFMSAILAVGDLIRSRTERKAHRVIADVVSFEQEEAWVRRDGQRQRTRVSELAIDDVVLVYPGHVIPVDGEVVAGTSAVDQAALTGESLPVTKCKQDRVFAGTLALDGVVEVRAERVGFDTSVARLVKAVTEGAKAPTSIEDYGRKFGDALVVPTLGISAVAAVVAQDLQRFTSMIIVDCGTGVRVAAPTAVLAQTIIAARQGVLVKGGQSLERLSEIDTIVFDKTGTLTQGSPAIGDISRFHGTHDPVALLRIAAAAESEFTHPVAQGLAKKARDLGIAVPEAEDVKYHVGFGVAACVEDKRVLLGSARFLARQGVDCSAAVAAVENQQKGGQSALLLAIEGTLSGLFPYADVLRPEAAAVVAALRQEGGQKVVMATGDNHMVARSIARQVGVDDFIAEVLPNEKVAYVERLQAQGHTVAVVGDGINDSPALAIADVGITVCNGVELAKESADVILMQENLWKVVEAFRIAAATMKLIKQDRSILLVANAGVFIVAGLGLLSPAVSSAISDGASIVATLNSIRPLLKAEKRAMAATRMDLAPRTAHAPLAQVTYNP
jgi:heavy metal translocating P-type ATPase